LGLALTLPAAAQAQDMAAGLKSCRTIVEVWLRAACYDRIVDGMAANARVAPNSTVQNSTVPSPIPSVAPVAAAPSASSPPAVPASPAAARPIVEATTPLARFGEKDLPAKAKIPENQTPPDEIIARATSVKLDGNGYMTVTLDNGQVWRQTESSPVRVLNGAAVKIRSGVMGVFYLSLASENRSARVKRIK